MKGFLAVSNTSVTEVVVDDAISAHLSHLEGVTVMNSAIVTFFALANQSEPENKFGLELLLHAFAEMRDMDYLFLISPAKSRLHAFMTETFTRIETKLGYFADKALLCLRREIVLPRLRIRRARVEDNDDLLPIFRSSASRHIVEEDDYFLANLIQNQNENDRFLVGTDSGGTPMGMLCTTRDVDLPKLAKVYDLSRYPAFASKSGSESRPKPVLLMLVGEISAVGTELLRQGALSLGFLYFDAKELEEENANNGGDENYMLEAFRHRLDKLLNPVSGSAPRGCVIGGYPLHTSQAVALKNSDFYFDYVFEMKGSRDRDQEDFTVLEEGLQEHLDAVQVLRQKSDESMFARSTWVDFSFDPHEERQAIAERLLADIIRSLSARTQRKKVSQDSAKVNVFAATLHCVHEHFASRADDLILAAFEDNKDCEFFFYMQPNEAPISPLTTSLTVVPLKKDMTSNQSLFVMHRDAITLRSELRVERYHESMKDKLQSFLSNQGPSSPSYASIIDGLAASDNISLKDNPVEVCFTAMVRDRIVGIISLSRKNMATEDLAMLRREYSVDKLLDFNRHRTRAQAFIQLFVLDIIHESRASYFLSEVMRLFGKTLLFYYDYPNKSTAEVLFQTLVPVRPRLWCGDAKKTQAQDSKHGAALYLTTKRLAGVKRIIAESKVVVVGTSASAMSILEEFVYSTQVYMTNITVIVEVVPHGLSPYHHIPENPDIKYKLPFSGCFAITNHQYLSDEEFTALGIYRRVKVKVGRVTDIDRSSRAAIVSDKAVVDYDLLVLSTGVQGWLISSSALIFEIRFFRCLPPHDSRTQGHPPLHLSVQGSIYPRKHNCRRRCHALD